MTTAFGYGRVSTSSQFDRANSLAAQSEQFVRFADSKGFDLGEPVERDFGEHGALTTRANVLFEGVSAFSRKFFDRPAGAEIARRLNAGDVLLFSKLDRGWRNVADCLNTLEALEARGVRVYLLNVLGGEPVDMSSWAGKLLITILAAFADCESGVRSERIRDARAVRQRSGLYNGGPPRVLFRAINDGGARRLEPCPDQRVHARLFFRLYAAEGWTIERIVEHARAKSIRIPASAVIRRRREATPSTAYQRQRIVGLIRAEWQIRQLAQSLGLADDDRAVLFAWLAQTAEETDVERKTLPAIRRRRTIDI